jgi:hypothetical protein
MAFQLSPGVNFSEIDLTNATAAVATTEGALAGVFRWGPVNERTLITSETELVNVFGEPSSRYTAANNTGLWTNAETFYTAANFLGYSDALFVTRVVGSSAVIATDQTSVSAFTAKYYGELGNSLELSFCKGTAAGANAFNGADGLPDGARVDITQGSKTATLTGLTDGAQAQTFKAGDKVAVKDASGDPLQDLTVASNVTPSASGTIEHTEVINFAAVTVASAGSDNTTEGVVLHVGTSSATQQASSIIILDGDISVTAGDPVVFDGSVASIPAGIVASQTYYAIPVASETDTLGDVLVVNAVGTVQTTNAIKLATTYAAARAYSQDDDTQTHVSITAAASDAANQAATGSLYGQTTASVTFVEKFAGITGAYAFNKHWGDYDLFDSAPSATDRLHVVVKDKDGKISGTAGTILETFGDVSTTAGVKKADGTSNFLSDVLEASSAWIKIAAGIAPPTGDSVSTVTISGGNDGTDEANITLGELVLGYDTFKDAGDVDISFVLQGKPRGTNGYELANYIIDNIAESRRDCVAFVSPELTDTKAQDIVDWAANVTASSYAVVDTGYKYQYDKYTDVYRWIPLNGDVAGLCARTDDLRDPWFSPAGYNRGNVKNVVKLKVNPNKSQRDLLYKNGINPVVTQAGQGTVLFGDKTYAGTTSAFDRINVRRLFIVLEKTIARAAKSTLFEFNDEFTRANFRNLVEPFLRDVQGRRGIYDFKVICDESNNTGQVIDTNSFVGDIYIKPARSINFIQLNFVAVRTGVEFSEVVGAA